MPGVIVKDDEPFEKALKRFKKSCEKAGIISDMKKHQHFEKPSERKKRKLNAAKRKRIKLEKILGEKWFCCLRNMYFLYIPGGSFNKLATAFLMNIEFEK